MDVNFIYLVYFLFFHFFHADMSAQYHKCVKNTHNYNFMSFKRDSLPQENFSNTCKKKYLFLFFKSKKPNFIFLNSRNIGHAEAQSFSSQLFAAKARLQ